jgi:hypothetical protein
VAICGETAQAFFAGHLTAFGTARLPPDSFGSSAVSGKASKDFLSLPGRGSNMTGKKKWEQHVAMQEATDNKGEAAGVWAWR